MSHNLLNKKKSEPGRDVTIGPPDFHLQPTLTRPERLVGTIYGPSGSDPHCSAVLDNLAGANMCTSVGR